MINRPTGTIKRTISTLRTLDRASLLMTRVVEPPRPRFPSMGLPQQAKSEDGGRDRGAEKRGCDAPFTEAETGNCEREARGERTDSRFPEMAARRPAPAAPDLPR